jgi:CRP-like cAMP-binding protein
MSLCILSKVTNKKLLHIRNKQYKEIALIINFIRINAKRVIIRQGQIADSFYFVITGHAIVTVMEQDKVTEEIKSRIATIIRGSNFQN